LEKVLPACVLMRKMNCENFALALRI